MSQLPNKAVIHGGASLAEAASDVFKTVREDQRAAVEARRKAEERRQTVSDGRKSATPAPAPTKPSITAATEEESEDEIQRSVELSPEWEEGGESVEPEPVKRPPGRPKKTETANKLGKRQREEAEAAQRQAEQERVEREARLQRERSEEARRMAEEQRARLRAAEEEEARRKAEEQRARLRAAEEEEARPRALEAAKRHQSMPPPSAPQVPPGGRGASLPPVTTPVVPKPPRVPESVRSFVEESDLFVDAQIATPRPRPPTPGKKPVHRVHNRPKNKTPKPHVHVAERLKSSLNPWSLWKVFLASLLILYAYRFIYSMARPDLFESPITSLRWYGWNKWKANAGQFFPSPLLHPLGVLTDKQYDNLKEYIHNESSSTEEAVKSLQSILPRMVHVKKDRRTNKLIIDDEFWRALKDQMHSDDSILTLDGKSDISDRQWRAIQKRLKNSGDIEDTAERTLTKSWEKWLRSNERKVADMIGKHLPQGKPGKHGGGDIQDIAITKEEFTRRLQPILDENKLTSAKIKELEKLVNKSLEKSRSTGDMSTINESRIKEIVNKAIKSAKLEAAASSEISRFDAELQKQLNHFGIGNGAMVDETFSSPTWEVVKPPLGSREWLKTLPSTPRFLVERSAALSAWDEAGHCWCAGTQINATHSRPADLFVHLSNFVIPQHVVLEHINPAATLDPGAMPKDIEIWAQFDEYHRKEKVRDFMEVTFPDAYRAKRNRDLVGRGFLQIGRFRYEHRASDRGVKVERLSRELVGLKAATDHVLVRAASNHGAGDHTCFYRIRLYGEVVALEAGERESRGW
ncbi:hypothetical protein QBC37DRAFT_284956 [Rhypophila decipiens]|uniref:SUN domain-containing protein n=1 Tax=Rhypophila decipiens TaxID=261697 RepID=A0AAN7B8G9_9PEZI|nr:hypothetical protein QBC37DRAFT_284956 [Rhypophila decipiens]